MKRIIAIVVAILLICLSVLPAFAKTVFTDGDWSYEITASNDSWEVDSYLGSDASVTLPASFGGLNIVAVGEHAFVNNDTVQEVTASALVAEIGEYAFSGCTALTTVTLPAGFTTLSIASFANDVLLTDINLEDTSVAAVPAYCFSGCTALTEIALPEGCAKLGNCAFLNCSALESIIIPASVTEIALTAFSGCENLVISAPYGSYAIQYAIDHEIDYQYTDVSQVSFIRGDADGDGILAIMDATKIQRVLARIEEDADGMIALRAKSGPEPVLSIMDATRIQRFLAKFEDPYGINKSVTMFIRPDGTVIDDADRAV